MKKKQYNKNRSTKTKFNKKHSFFLVIFFFLIIILIVYGISISKNPLITDDVTPAYTCPTLLKKSDILFVIPNYKNNPIDQFPKWCEELRILNKTIGLHGITHEYHEFNKKVSDIKLEQAIMMFETCFGYKPTFFRPPYNKISPENKALVESFNMIIYKDTYVVHPYCHCEPKSWMRFLNWIIGC